MSPVASKTVMPRRCAFVSAARTGARSASAANASQPQPIDRLHTDPGNRRAASSNIRPIFSKVPPPCSVGRALTTTSRASGAIAWATSRSITVSPCGGSSGAPITTGAKRGSPEMSANMSRSRWSYPSNPKMTIVAPLPV